MPGALCVDSSIKGNHGTLEGDVKRVMCTRDRVEPAKTRIPEVMFEPPEGWAMGLAAHRKETPEPPEHTEAGGGGRRASDAGERRAKPAR